MNYIDAELRLYNANSRSRNVGDCVKRSLSLAYGMDYDDLSSELNAFKRRKYGKDSDSGLAYNNDLVFDAFIRSKGCEWQGVPRKLGFDQLPTVQQFSELLSSGTYCLLCGKTGNVSTHMVCVIDGDIWDSWNSSNYVVTYIYAISKAVTKFAKTLSIDDFYDELREFVSESMQKFLKKMPYASFDIDPYGKQKSKDEYSSQITVHLFLNQQIRNELNIPSIREKYGKSFTIKMNPKFTDEENLQKIKDKLYYNLREWCYANRKAIQDILDSRKLVTHPKFRGERNLLLKIPEEYRSKIITIYDRGNNDWSDRYYADVEADPNDPRYDPQDPELSIYGENLKELIYNLKSYYTEYKRFGYDY